MRAGLFGPVKSSPFWGWIAIYLVIRLWLAILPGYAPDVADYKEWALGVATDGLPAAYGGLGVDYPPVLLYPLAVAGETYLRVGPRGPGGEPVDSDLLTVLVKMPPLVFDLIIAAILGWLVGRTGLWGPRRRDPGWGRLAALLYLFNPAVLWLSGYWGQADAVHTAFATAGVAALAVGRPGASGLWTSAACLSKPLAGPLVPLMVAGAATARGFRGVLALGVGGIAAALLIFLPFAVAGRLADALRRVFLDVGAMPVTSANAHNLWWLLGPWRRADTTVLGFLTPTTVGLGLFAAAYLALLVRMVQWRQRPRDDDYRAEIFLMAAAVSAVFFFLSTHLHENQLFLALPLLLAVAGRNRTLAWLAVGCSAVIFVNCFLHDLEVPYLLPGLLSASSSVTDPNFHRPYTYLQLFGSHANALGAAVVAGGVWLAAWRGRT